MEGNLQLQDIRESDVEPDILSALPVGTQLRGGRYVIRGVLGRGGFGITYRAEDMQNSGTFEESEVVVKELFVSGGEVLSCTRQGRTVIPTGHRRGDYSDFIKKFDGEARMLHKYKHVPGVVKVTDLFGENETAYFVMSCIEGQTLKQIIAKEGPLSLERTASILRSLAETLTHLHRDKVLHRDIKPENIMVTDSEEVYLIDFGLAKAYISGKTRVDTGNHTPRYASPEQMMSRSVPGSASPDIYSLAATVYSMLTGKLPQTTEERNYDGYTPVSAVIPSIPSHVDAAITRGMAFRHEDRQSSVAAFYEEFVASRTQRPRPQPTPRPIDSNRDDKINQFIKENYDNFSKEKHNEIKRILREASDEKFERLCVEPYYNCAKTMAFSYIFGFLGVDRFMIDDVGLGVLKLLTCGGAGIWWIADLATSFNRIRGRNLEKIKNV